MANTAMFMSLLLIVIGFLNLAVLVIQTHLLLNMSSPDYKNCTRLCLPCETEKDRVCCGCQVDSLRGYLTKLYKRFKEDAGKRTDVEDQHDTDTYHVSSYNKPAAKLAGDKENDSKKSEMKSVRSWRTDNMCYIVNGMTLRHGRLVIPLAGLYHVYVMFDLVRYLNSTKGASIVVMRYNILKNEEVLFSRPLSDWASLVPQNNYQHVYLGADFKLYPEDEVYVKINQNLLFRNPSANVFGIYML